MQRMKMPLSIILSLHASVYKRRFIIDYKYPSQQESYFWLKFRTYIIICFYHIWIETTGREVRNHFPKIARQLVFYDFISVIMSIFKFWYYHPNTTRQRIYLDTQFDDVKSGLNLSLSCHLKVLMTCCLFQLWSNH